MSFRFNAGVLERFGEERGGHVLQACATVIRDEIVQQMEESDPSGAIYRIPGTEATYQASAPGQPPAVREGVYRDSWTIGLPVKRADGKLVIRVFTALKVGQHTLGELLEFGTANMAPRPHVRPALANAQPLLEQIVRDASDG